MVVAELLHFEPGRPAVDGEDVRGHHPRGRAHFGHVQLAAGERLGRSL